MATATPPASSKAPVMHLNDAQRKIRDPLSRLRNWIRGYVTVEGALVLVLYVALWFWIGLILDYGAFKIPFLQYDWVQEMPWAVRAVVLGLLVAGLLAAVTLKVLLRLFTEFRDSALALVLERRFPKILGDRLITAIELHDLRRAEKQGYSVAMINQTVQEAAARVDQLPIKEVFNWKRLTLQTIAVVALTVVSYLVALCIFAFGGRLADNKATLADGVRDFHQVSLIWFQRDVLLQDVIWPRRSFLVLVQPWPMDDKGRPENSINLGQNAPPQPIRFRALEYVMADRQAPEGWRPMSLADARKLAGKMPDAPSDWQPRTGEAEVTTDGAALQLSRFDVRKTIPGRDGTWFLADVQDETGWRPLRTGDLSKERLGGLEVPAIPDLWAASHESDVWALDEISAKLNEAGAGDNAAYADWRHVVARLERYSDFHDAFEALNGKLAERGMGGKARRLVVPRSVTVNFYGRTASNTMPLTTLPDNEYSGTFTDLKDTGVPLPWTFTFRAHGEDYFSLPRQIKVVAAPNLTNIVRQERRPAFLYYQPYGDLTVKELRGKKQLMSQTFESAHGGETTRIDVPAGTDVTLTFVADKPIKTIHALKRRGNLEEIQPTPTFDMISMPGQEPGTTFEADRTFRATFPDVRQEVNFVLEFTDADGVVGYRSVVIRPGEDFAPDVDLEPQLTRKTKDGIPITPLARIPFKGKVTDKHGLSAANFAYTVAPIEVGTGTQNIDAMILSAAIPLMNPEGQNYLFGLTYLNIAVQHANKAAAAAGQLKSQYRPVAGFDKALKDANQHYSGATLLNLATVTTLLNQPQQAPYRSLFKEYVLTPDNPEKPEFDPIVNDFPVADLKLLETESLKTQKRYRMQLWLEGVNTDIESSSTGEPRVSPSKDKFTFVIVPEGELLNEIGKDEENLYGRLGEVLSRLIESHTKLTQVTYDLDNPTLKQAELAPMSVRTDEVDQVLDKTQAIVKEALVDYSNILTELKINQIKGEKINQVETIVGLMGEVDGTDFLRARDRIVSLRKALDSKDFSNILEQLTEARKAGKDAKDKLQIVIDKLHKVMDQMQGIIDLGKQIKVLRDIVEAEREQHDFWEKYLKILLKDLFGDEPKKP